MVRRNASITVSTVIVCTWPRPQDRLGRLLLYEVTLLPTKAIDSKTPHGFFENKTAMSTQIFRVSPETRLLRHFPGHLHCAVVPYMCWIAAS